MAVTRDEARLYSNYLLPKPIGHLLPDKVASGHEVLISASIAASFRVSIGLTR